MTSASVAPVEGRFWRDSTLLWVDQILELEAPASVAYNDFAFDSSSVAYAVRRALFIAGVAEYSDPFCRLFVDSGRALGMYALLDAASLRRRRLAAAVWMTRNASSPLMPESAGRLQSAASTLMKVAPSDAYLGRLAVSSAVRGKGLGRYLLQCALDESRDLGATRCVLDVASNNDRAIKVYRDAGFHDIGKTRATAPNGRSLEHLHLAIEL